MVEYIMVFILGLMIGSFLNVCIYRIPEGQSIVAPPSRCPSCNTRLAAVDLVPVLSYVFLRGKCRHCEAKISARYPLIELLTAFTFAVVFFKYGMSIETVALIFLFSILIAVFFIDLDHKIIPDELVITGLAGGVALIIYNLFYPVSIYAGDRSWWNPVVGMFTGSGILFLVALLGMLIYKTDEAMGMGDVKIFAPIGIFLGWKLTLIALMLSIFMGGITGVILIALDSKRRKDTIPFGPFIVLGTFAAAMWGWDILNWYLSHLLA